MIGRRTEVWIVINRLEHSMGIVLNVSFTPQSDIWFVTVSTRNKRTSKRDCLMNQGFRSGYIVIINWFKLCCHLFYLLCLFNKSNWNVDSISCGSTGNSNNCVNVVNCFCSFSSRCPCRIFNTNLLKKRIAVLKLN